VPSKSDPRPTPCSPTCSSIRDENSPEPHGRLVPHVPVLPVAPRDPGPAVLARVTAGRVSRARRGSPPTRPIIPGRTPDHRFGASSSTWARKSAKGGTAGPFCRPLAVWEASFLPPSRCFAGISKRHGEKLAGTPRGQPQEAEGVSAARNDTLVQQKDGIRMTDQQIRDPSNKLVATIKTTFSGKQEIRDPSNRLLGTYDPKSNETRDPSNRLVAKGNVLTTLVKPF
jgi:hypothetical protein